MATGVLVLGVERATRLLGHLMLTEKAYDATARLGVATVTDDAEGEVTATASAAHLDEAAVRAAFAEQVGELSSRCRRPCPRSRSTACAPTSGCGTARRSPSSRAGDRPRAVVTRPRGVAGSGRSTSTSRCAAPAAPTCARSPVTSAPRSASAVTSPRCAVPRSGRTASTSRTRWTSSPRRSGCSRSPTRPGRRSRRVDLDEPRPPTSRSAARSTSHLDAADRGVRARTASSWRSTSRGTALPAPSLCSSERLVGRLRPVQIWRSLDEVPADLGRTVVTIGNFDGVHLGHQHVLAGPARSPRARGWPWSR